MRQTLGLLLICGLLVSCTNPDLSGERTTGIRKSVGASARVSVGPARGVPPASPFGQRGPAVAFGGDVYLLLWQDGFSGVGGESDILAMRVDDKGAAMDSRPLAVCTAEGGQEAPAVAFGGGRFLAVWADRRDGHYDVRGAFFSPDGGAIGEEFLVAGGKGAQTCPAVTSNGRDRFFVVWQGFVNDHFEIHGARIDAASGKLLDAQPVQIMPRGERPSVAWTGSQYFVCQKWYAAIVSADGKLVVPVVQSWSDKISSWSNAAAAWGKGFAFMNCQPFPDPWGWSGNGSILGATITADGGAPEREAAAVFKNRTDWTDRFSGAKADGRVPNCLDAARWANHPGWPMGMRGALKHTMGDTWPSGTPAACYNARSLLVVWPRGRLVDTRRLRHRELYMARVLPDWGVLDRPAVRIVAEDGEVANPALAAGPAGEALLAYERVTATGPVVEYRLLTEAEDRDPPKVRYVVPMSATKSVVAFDEPVDAASVRADGFRIDGLRVAAAEWNADGRAGGREVVLTTSPPKVGTRYTLHTSGVKDRSPARNTAAGERFEFLAKPGRMQRTDYIAHWCVLGPFPRDVKSHPFDPAAARPAPGEEIKTPAGAVKWAALDGQAINLGAKFGEGGNQMIYAAVWFFSDRPRDAVLRLDTNDHNRAWLNGRLVNDGISTATASRGFHDRADELPVRLRQGWNPLLLQVANQQTTWMMVAQITDAAGVPIRDLTWQIQRPTGQ